MDLTQYNRYLFLPYWHKESRGLNPQAVHIKVPTFLHDHSGTTRGSTTEIIFQIL